jgi:rubredoxin
MAKAVVASGRRVSILLILLSLLSLIRGFAPITIPSTAAVRSGPSSTQLYFFGQPKDDGSPGDYLCPDCGYVFTKGPKAWAALPDSYSCPPCGAPKRRFKKIPKGSSSGKVEVKKSWF